jgi:streptomycin 6-kinase
MLDLPARFIRTIHGTFGDEGRAWLERLPSLLSHYAARWQLQLLSPFALSYNYVVAATRADGTPVVLKLGVPNSELLTEIAALQLFDGRGAARVIEADPDGGALLIERLMPGTTLATIDDDEQATAIAIQVMQRLWQPLPADHPFPSLRRWTRAIGRHRESFGGAGPLPAPLFERAERLLDELLESEPAPVLLHGDLHHENILHAGNDRWLAIDPKGAAGDPAFEVGTFLHNRLPKQIDSPATQRLLDRRVSQLAEGLGIDRERVLAWGVTHAVLSAVWSVEDDTPWQRTIACGEVLAGMI